MHLQKNKKLLLKSYNLNDVLGGVEEGKEITYEK